VPEGALHVQLSWWNRIMQLDLVGRRAGAHADDPAAGNAYDRARRRTDPLARGRKAWALLTYVLLAGRQPSRRQLAELLFDEAEDPLGAVR
jgi:hypothetical protein